jgi:hypothetical protein
LIHDGRRREGAGPGWLELRREQIPARTRWERRSGQWRALALARYVFGAEASARLDGFPPRGGFRGLLHLEVPFLDLEDHREKETLFLAMASADPVLEQVPLVYVFEPVAEWVEVGGGGTPVAGAGRSG